MRRLTRFQHFVALLIIIPAIPLEGAGLVIRTIADWCETLCGWCAQPFWFLHRRWVDRCAALRALEAQEGQSDD